MRAIVGSVGAMFVIAGGTACMVVATIIPTISKTDHSPYWEEMNSIAVEQSQGYDAVYKQYLLNKKNDPIKAHEELDVKTREIDHQSKSRFRLCKYKYGKS